MTSVISWNALSRSFHLLLLVTLVSSMSFTKYSEASNLEKKKGGAPEIGSRGKQHSKKSSDSNDSHDSMKVDASVPADEEIDEADVLITNRRLRADTGSLSNWSLSIFTNYQGGSLAHPVDPERPNIAAGGDVLTLQNLTGTAGIRYRFNTKDSLTLRLGFFMTTPFHSSITTDNPDLKKNFNDNSQKLDVNDPSLRYIHVDKLFGVQSVTEVEYARITNGQQRSSFDARYYFAQTFMKDVGETGFGYGSHFTFTNYELDHPSPGESSPTRALIGIYPFMEYEINDTYNIRTVWGWQVLERSKSTSSYQKRKVYQSVGLGISLTRDIFLYPNIQFIPSDINSDKTNIAISANINVF